MENKTRQRLFAIGLKLCSVINAIKVTIQSLDANPRSRSSSQAAPPIAAPTPPVSGASTLFSLNLISPLIRPLSASLQ